MEENTKVDKAYQEAFNQGYKLSKELGLDQNFLKSIKPKDERFQGIKDGMLQYQKDMEFDKSKITQKTIIPPFDMNSVDKENVSKNLNKDKTKDKGKDIDL